MSELQGYSFVQKAQLDALAIRADNVDTEVDKRVEVNVFDDKIASLDNSDDQHFIDIESIRNNRVALSNYNDAVSRLTNIDTTREQNISALTTDYTGKISTGVVTEKLKELDAISVNHDLRLD